VHAGGEGYVGGVYNAVSLWENAETLTERLQISHIRTVNLSFAPASVLVEAGPSLLPKKWAAGCCAAD
jgi:hypothetical protein